MGENLCLLAGKEISFLHELYQDNIDEKVEPKLTDSLLVHALMALRSVSDLNRSCVVFEGMLEEKAEVRFDC